MVKIKKIIASFFVVLFASYYGGATLFSHIHIVNGVTIVHSHFHTESHHNTKSGGHTAQSVTLIAQISHFDYIDFVCDCIPKPPQLLLHKNKFIETTHWVASIHFQHLSLRAPPIV